MPAESNVVIPGGAKVKDIFAALDAWAINDDTSSIQCESLWYLLTALRGPDNANGDVKWATTAVIRAVTLPELSIIMGCDVVQSAHVIANTLKDLSTRDAIEDCVVTRAAKLDLTTGRAVPDEDIPALVSQLRHFMAHISTALSAIEREELAAGL